MFDCHMHPITIEDYNFFKKSSNASKVLNIRSINNPCLQQPFDFNEFKNIKEMYFLDSVDLDDLNNELIRVEDDLKKYPKLKKRLMYGTDFFINDIAFNNVSSYEILVNNLDLTKSEKQNIFKYNIYEAYPMLLV